jgi:hypothetical protein
MKEEYGCDLFFDYNLEDKFCEKKVFENERCSIFKYSLAQPFIKVD